MPIARIDNLHIAAQHQQALNLTGKEQTKPINPNDLPDYPYADRPDLYTHYREPGSGRVMPLPAAQASQTNANANANQNHPSSTAANDDDWGAAQVYYFQTDQIGTPRELTHHSGQLAWQATYQTWGNTVTCEWVEETELSQTALQQQQEQTRIAQNLRFQGQYFDVETGLHYNRFRYYDRKRSANPSIFFI